MTEKKEAFRVLTLITTPKLADKATEVLTEQGLLIEERLPAVGTAPSRIMDILGLGSTDKIILLSFMPKKLSYDILHKIGKRLHLGTANTGIAFTLPLTGMNNSMVKMLQNINYTESKEGHIMYDTTYTLICANVNRGYSNDVMDAAREAGASGGSVINSRRIADEALCSKWGLGNQEEKELVIIVASSESKVPIMKKISEKCGMSTDAKGMVFSLPIDAVEGL